MNVPKCSIITIVYNGAKVLERTMQSIFSQHCNHYEYIVIDGGSVDGTVDIIRRYEKQITYWVSEPDKGLYDAMNKGMAKATGDYVWFLNAGDQIFSDDTLEKVLSCCGNDPDIVYGETMVVDESGKDIGMRRLRTPENLNRNSLRDGMVVCHQSVLVRRSIAGRYDTRLHLAADYAWLLEVLCKAKKICNSHLVLCRFLEGGLNKKNIFSALKERFGVMVKYYGFLPTLFRHFLIGWRFFGYLIRNKRF